MDESKPMDIPAVSQDRIRERAYALWERDGRPEGGASDYWFRACAEIEAEDVEPGNEMPANISGELSPSAVTE